VIRTRGSLEDIGAGIPQAIADVDPVAERMREIGIRLALGASAGQVMRSVVIPGIVMAGAGAAIGGVLAIVVARVLQSLIWGVSPTDPSTLVAVSAVLFAVALAAGVIPALRIMRVDPALTRRAE
jgi:putative ABC transport system permease protein